MIYDIIQSISHTKLMVFWNKIFFIFFKALNTATKQTCVLCNTFVNLILLIGGLLLQYLFKECQEKKHNAYFCKANFISSVWKFEFKIFNSIVLFNRRLTIKYIWLLLSLLLLFIIKYIIKNQSDQKEYCYKFQELVFL